MKIAIDASQIIYGTGVSVYTKNLIQHLLKIDRENEYILYGGSLRRTDELKSILYEFNGKRVERKTFPMPQTLAHIIWNKLHILPVEKLIGKVDIFHSSDWTQPPSRAFKVTTIHDLVPMKYPKLSNPKLVSNQTSRFKWIKSEVDRVIAPSETTAEDVKRLGIDKNKIRVIPEAVDVRFKPAKRSEIEAVKRKYRISGKYMIAVGVNERKNTQRIIEAYEKVKSETNMKLIIVGKPFIPLNQTRGVSFLDHVQTETLSVLYSGAEVLVYPSLYEGFGLPILEAFVCRTPVVTSNIGSMAEVAGKAAVVVDPYDTQSIIEGIYQALSKKEKLIKMGLIQAKKYSWQKTAEDTLNIYQESVG